MTSIVSFIRKTPAPSLRAYFNQAGIELPSAVNWNASEPDLVQPLLQAVDDMDPRSKARVMLDAGRVIALADEAGQTALYSVAGDRAFLDGLAGPHDRALWMFLKEEPRFRQAEEVRFTDERRRGRSWEGYNVEPNCVVRRDPTSIESFKAAVRLHFQSANVHVDVFDRHRITFDGQDCELIQVTIYREGLPNDDLEFDRSALVRRVRNPVYEAALTYEPAAGVIEVVANDRESRQEMAGFMARDLLGIEFEGNRLPARRYDLSVLMQPFDFPCDIADGIESVTLKQLRLMPYDAPGERVTLECMRGTEQSIWEMADGRFGDRSPLLGGWVATQAKLVIRFRPKAGAARGRVLSLSITMPHGCNLKDLTAEEQLIGNKYMRCWRILTGTGSAAAH